MEVPTFWVEICTCKIPKCDRSSSRRPRFAKCYIDDIITFNSTMDEHGHHLKDVFEHFGGAWVEIAPRKM
jgi:hypothetical protein